MENYKVKPEVEDTIKDVRRELNKHLKKYSEIAELLESIQNEADTYLEMWAKRDGADNEANSLRTEIVSLQDERRQLKEDWTEAQFEDDFEKQNQLTTRRDEVDTKLTELGERIDTLRTTAEENTPSSVEVAKLKARLDSMPKKNPEYILNKIKPLLQGLDSQLSGVAFDLNLSDAFREFDEEVYEAERLEQDGPYAASHRAIEKEAAAFKRREEHAKNWRNPFDSPPKVDPSVKRGTLIGS